MGCHLRYHKWDKFKMLAPSRLGDFNRTLWRGAGKSIAALANVATIVSTGLAVVTLVVST